MRGELSSSPQSKRHPLDWYVDEGWCTEQLIRAIGFDREIYADLAIWDPCCGYGHIPATFAGWDSRFRVICSDLVDNLDRSAFEAEPRFFSADFLELDAAPERCSIVFNPPYSYRKGILEACIRQAVRLATGRVVAMVPNKWLASQGRYFLFAQDHVPTTVLHYCQRPSMPPGDMIEAMGDRAYRGGKIDYAAIVWDVQRPVRHGQTRTMWLPPLSLAPSDSDDGPDDGDEF